MANNHQGNVEHGLAIIREAAEAARKNNIKAAIKFQYRDLDTFIHPDFVNDKTNKHIPRFMSTRLSAEQFLTLVHEAKRLGLLTACTPFDEKSVDLIEKHGIDIIKIASCSARDKPLLKRISETDKPIVLSTAGATLKDIDYAVNLFESKGRDFALMHCVALYPTPIEKMNLDRIDVLKRRYGVPVGFSTHEDPNEAMAMQLAVAKGAQLFEKHIGKPTEVIKLNAYSANMEQVSNWISQIKHAKKYLGKNVLDYPEDEIESLRSLERGVYLKKDIKKGEIILSNDVFFAMPRQKGQMSSGEFFDGIIADHDYKNKSPLSESEKRNTPEEIKAYAIQTAKSLLRDAGIKLGNEYEVELSHHYGVDKLPEVGLVMINCVDRDYCKKLLVQLPGQFHPEHTHKTKEETFHQLYGTLDVSIDGTKRRLYAGDKLLIVPGQKHSFSTETGAVIEEISTKYEKGGSVYTDTSIFSSNPDSRKTYLGKW